jgi:hypothetical protein
MTLTILIALMSAFREAQADESVMISFGPYSPECVEVGRGILRSSPKVSINVPFGALRDAYGDVLCLLAFYPDTGPGIRRAEVLASK